ncbi:T9SS type A sorting domain-containing protein [Jejuia pallidilutea]|uniref:T9SS type A sorting domain-containing protein n=1 Tax=Jejuia pallidilutea TaxID=504487 RepID=UPI001269951D
MLLKINLTLTTEFPLLIQICNINGMVLNTLKFESGVTNIDLKMLNNGLYFFKIKEISNTGSQRQGVFKILKH